MRIDQDQLAIDIVNVVAMRAEPNGLALTALFGELHAAYLPDEEFFSAKSNRFCNLVCDVVERLHQQEAVSFSSYKVSLV